MKRGIPVVISFFFLLPAMICAQNNHFDASCDKDTIAYYETFELSISIQNLSGQFQAPNFRDFNLVGGPNVSSSYSMINGTVEQSMNYQYYLRARKPGRLSIDPAELLIQDETIKTDSIFIYVLPPTEEELQDDNVKESVQPEKKKRKNVKI